MEFSTDQTVDFVTNIRVNCRLTVKTNRFRVKNGQIRVKTVSSDLQLEYALLKSPLFQDSGQIFEMQLNLTQLNHEKVMKIYGL